MNDDSAKILSIFSKLSSKQMDKVYRLALSKGARVLIKESKNELGKVVKGGKKPHVWKGGSTTTLYKGIKLGKAKNQEDKSIVKVHIMGEPRLKWFELGTKERFTKKWKGKALKKPRRTGIIRKQYFFAKAQTNKEKEVFDNIDKYLTDIILKIAK